MDPLPLYRVFAPVAAVAVLAVACAVRPVLRLRATLVGVVALCGYGMLQDQVTVRLCPEYFTALHPPVPGLTDPTLLGVAWGFLGSWWGGAILGYAAGVAATVGPRPPLGLWAVARGVLGVVAVTAGVALLTGANVSRHADLFGVTFGPELDGAVPPERRRAALAVACTHAAAYATAVVGSVVLCVRLAARRRWLRLVRPSPDR